MPDNEKLVPEEAGPTIDEAVTRAQYDEVVALLKSTRAEFENYQKRMARERESDRKYYVSALARDMLTVVDNLDRAIEAAKNAKVLSEAQDLATKLGSVTLTISRQVGEGDRLYGSVTHRDIEEALGTKGFVVDRRRIVTEPLKALGTHDVQIKLAPTVTATIKVEVAAKA